MTVIGRLDDQVDSVLIAPLDRNRRRSTEAKEQPENEQAAPPQTDAQAPDEAESFQHEQVEREELPVWLL